MGGGGNIWPVSAGRLRKDIVRVEMLLDKGSVGYFTNPRR